MFAVSKSWTNVYFNNLFCLVLMWFSALFCFLWVLVLMLISEARKVIHQLLTSWSW